MRSSTFREFNSPSEYGPDRRVLTLLRKAASEGKSVAQLLEILDASLAPAKVSPYTALLYFRGAFDISLREGRIFETTRFYDCGDLSDEELDAALRPLIVKFLQEWDWRDIVDPDLNKADEHASDNQKSVDPGSVIETDATTISLLAAPSTEGFVHQVIAQTGSPGVESKE